MQDVKHLWVKKIIDGCRLHGLSLKQTEDLIYEINYIIKNKN